MNLDKKIKEAYQQSSFAPERNRMRTATYENVEHALLKWFTSVDAAMVGLFVLKIATTSHLKKNVERQNLLMLTLKL